MRLCFFPMHGEHHPISQFLQRQAEHSERAEQSTLLREGRYDCGLDELEKEHWIHGRIWYRLAV